MAIKSYMDLDVFQMAFEAAMWIFERSKSWPREERYALTVQIWKTSRSVCANIVEAWRRRRLYAGAFLTRLSDAEAEAAETQVWLRFALRCKYITEAEFNKWHDHYDTICAKLVAMSRQPEKWCPKEALNNPTAVRKANRWKAAAP